MHIFLEIEKIQMKLIEGERERDSERETQTKTKKEGDSG